jgi:hypothetical protein
MTERQRSRLWAVVLAGLFGAMIGGIGCTRDGCQVTIVKDSSGGGVVRNVCE